MSGSSGISDLGVSDSKSGSASVIDDEARHKLFLWSACRWLAMCWMWGAATVYPTDVYHVTALA